MKIARLGQPSPMAQYGGPNEHHFFSTKKHASPWERDPLETEAQRAERDALIATAGAQSPAEEYIVMRAATRRVLGLPDINIVE